MSYAEVSVNSPVAQRRTFSYRIPEGMAVRQGQAVLVPFGERVLQGIVLEVTPQPSVEEVRDIAGLIEPELVLPPHHLALARALSQHYLSPLFETLGLVLPPGFERNAVTLLRATSKEVVLADLNEAQRRALDIVGAGEAGLKTLQKELGQRKAAAAVAVLVKQGILERHYRLEPVRVQPKYELHLQLAGTPPEKLAVKQAALVDYLKDYPDGVAWALAREATGVQKATANALAARGIIRFHEIEVPREPVNYDLITLTQPLLLTPAQQRSYQAIVNGLDRADGRVFLLHGVTGSGKTEVYLQALAETVRRGQRGIVLVPEIALTPQTIERFAARFPHRVAVLHSGLSLGEQYDEWRRIRDGEFDVVVGSRSAIFAPQPNLGLIVIDEEHEWTYKQDATPYYHARDAAQRLAELTGATLVLGSATPDVETFYKARQGEYTLLELPERIAVAGGSLPPVTVIDLREELKRGNSGLFSRELTAAINEVIDRRQQVILFLNRRGGATFIQCRRCGHVLRCRRCEVPVSHHISAGVLTCHQCGRRYRIPEACPECGSPRLKYLGTGTQKLEQEVRLTFPRARILRWDSDTVTGSTSHEDILRDFRAGKADILIGTQMVAKGLDIPAVTLVGVMNADTSLNLPDFRAGERTFQLLSQVAGRAGRGAAGGKVIIQTYTPEYYAVRAAAGHDYASFYEQEIGYRRELQTPPFNRLARLIFTHGSDEAGRQEATRVAEMLRQELAARGLAGIDVIGPAPSFIHRLRGRYRWQLVLRGIELPGFLREIPLPAGWSVDIDPVGMLR